MLKLGFGKPLAGKNKQINLETENVKFEDKAEALGQELGSMLMQVYPKQNQAQMIKAMTAILTIMYREIDMDRKLRSCDESNNVDA
jgi:hypothetical protein